MPPRVTYWTGTFDPAREAISKEVQTLRHAVQPSAPVVSLSSAQRSSISPRDRVIRLAGARWMVFRATAALLEPLGQVTHAFGAMHAWHLLRALGRRPMIFTVALPGPSLEPTLYEKVTVFVAESECLADDLRRAGIRSDRIRVIYPGVNLQEYRPVTRAGRDRFHVLFASAPSDAGEFEARGISLLVDVARLCPEIDVTLLWRSWGDQQAARRAFANLNPPENIRIDMRRGRDMASIYQDADAVACLYEPGFGKSCPNSIVEALACGVPALVSATCGIAGLIARDGAGIATTRSPADVADAVRTLRTEPARFSAAARRLAERHFDVRQFVDAYARLYQSTAEGAAVAGRLGVLQPGMSRGTQAGQRGR
jgi:glycosyltransferase involved in cell wall biosynthesis